MYKIIHNTNNLFINPFTTTTRDLQKYNPNMQLEIIELQISTILKCKYKKLSVDQVIGFWKCIPKKDFRELHILALKLICRFGSTHKCEKKIFSGEFY